MSSAKTAAVISPVAKMVCAKKMPVYPALQKL